MPLFGHKNKNHDTVAHTDRHAMDTGVTGVNRGTGAGGAGNFAPATGGGRHDNNLSHTGAGATTGFNEPGYGHNNNTVYDQQRHGFDAGAGVNDPYSAAGVGHGNANTHGAGAAGIPPTGTLNDHNQSRGGTGSRMTGKVESAVGTMLGSNSLKAKGLQKEQEANAIKLQGQELAEAERLEREALMRRERAVGHGAHPENRHLGAGHTGTGTGTGTGPYN